MTQIIWAMDLDDYNRPIRAHQIVKEENDTRTSVCGEKFTKSNHPKGWWSTSVNRRPLPEDDIHCSQI